LFKITWGIFNDTNTYNIRYRISTDTEWIEINNVSGDVFFIGTQEYREIEGISLAYCTNYEFEIAATCDSNFTGNVSTYSFQTTGCCTAPIQFGFVSIDDTSVNLNWQNVFGSTFYQLEYRIVGETDYILVEEIVGDTYVLENLQACTEYQARLKTLCEDSSSASYSDFSFFTKGCGACDSVYCISIAADASLEYILAVQIGGYTNESGNNDGYASFANSGIELNLESSYPIKLTPGFEDDNYNELAFQEALASQEFVDSQITIPSTAIIGLTKLRIVMKYFSSGGNAQACEEEFGYGEVEDYCIEILQAPVGLEDLKEKEKLVQLFPNPANKLIEVLIANEVSIAEKKLNIYDVSGRILLVQLLNSGKNQIDISGLAEGVYNYSIVGIESNIQNGNFVKIR
jgi:Secretion system C-terminal sorting domain/GEVED domain